MEHGSTDSLMIDVQRSNDSCGDTSAVDICWPPTTT